MLFALAVSQSFRTGSAILSRRVCLQLVRRGNLLTAQVEGSTLPYYQVAVTLADAGGIADASCTCPYDWGGYCKHIVAVLLAALEDTSVVVKPDLEALLASLTENDSAASCKRSRGSASWSTIERQVRWLTQQPAAAGPMASVQHSIPVDPAIRREIGKDLRSFEHGGGRRWGGHYDYWDNRPARSTRSGAGTPSGAGRAAAGCWRSGHGSQRDRRCGRGLGPGISDLDEWIHEANEDAFAEAGRLSLLLAEALLSMDLTPEQDARNGTSTPKRHWRTASTSRSSKPRWINGGTTPPWQPPWRAISATGAGREKRPILPTSSHWRGCASCSVRDASRSTFTSPRQRDRPASTSICWPAAARSNTPLSRLNGIWLFPRRFYPWRRRCSAGRANSSPGRRRLSPSGSTSTEAQRATGALDGGAGRTGWRPGPGPACSRVASRRAGPGRLQDRRAAGRHEWPTLKTALLAQIGEPGVRGNPLDVYLYEQMWVEAMALIDRSPWSGDLKRVIEATHAQYPSWGIQHCKRQAESIMDAKKPRTTIALSNGCVFRGTSLPSMAALLNGKTISPACWRSMSENTS